MNKSLNQDTDLKVSEPEKNHSPITHSNDTDSKYISSKVIEPESVDTKNSALVNEKQSASDANISQPKNSHPHNMGGNKPPHENTEQNRNNDIEIQGPMQDSTPPEEYEPLPLIAIGLCVIAGSYLFNVYGLAVNVVIFSALLAITFAFVHRLKKPKTKSISLIIIGSLFIFSFAWRESGILRLLNFVALLALILMTLSKINNKTNHFYLIDLFSSFFRALHKLLMSPITNTRQEIKHIGRHPGLKRSLWGVMRGLAISLPFVILAGTLLTSADTGFSNYINNLFSLSFSIPSFTIPLIISAFIAIAFLTQIKPYQPLGWYQSLSSSFSLPGVEVFTVLTALNIVFALYIKVQIAYYFGDDSMIQNTTGIAYAEYARTGFFQLVSLSIVVLGFLWSLAWFIRKDIQAFGFWFKIMSLIMIGLLVIIEASAIHRMVLYTNAYGLTEARFYALALMLWVGLIYIIFTLTILKSKRGQFLGNALSCGMGIVVILNIINPAALIAKYNLTHAAKIKLDLPYLTDLGPDAYPTILAKLNKVDHKYRCSIINYIEENLHRSFNDWRTWSWGIQNTRHALSTLKIKCPVNQDPSVK